MYYIIFLVSLLVLSNIFFFIYTHYIYKKHEDHRKYIGNITTTKIEKVIKVKSVYYTVPRIMFWYGIIGILGTFLFSIIYVPENKVAIFYRFGYIQNHVRFSGIHFKSPFRDAILYPTGILKKNIDGIKFVYEIDGAKIPYLIAIRRISGINDLNLLTLEVLRGKIRKEEAFYIGDFIRIIDKDKIVYNENVKPKGK